MVEGEPREAAPEFKRGEIGDFGGGSLEHLRPWQGSRRPGPWECRAARGRQARPEEVQESSWGTAEGVTNR